MLDTMSAILFQAAGTLVSMICAPVIVAHVDLFER